MSAKRDDEWVPETWARVKQLFQEALGRDPELRAAFLEDTCAEDAALLRSVKALLAAHDEAGDFLEAPAEVARRRKTSR